MKLQIKDITNRFNEFAFDKSNYILNKKKQYVQDVKLGKHVFNIVLSRSGDQLEFTNGDDKFTYKKGDPIDALVSYLANYTGADEEIISNWLVDPYYYYAGPESKIHKLTQLLVSSLNEHKSFIKVVDDWVIMANKSDNLAGYLVKEKGNYQFIKNNEADLDDYFIENYRSEQAARILYNMYSEVYD